MFYFKIKPIEGYEYFIPTRENPTDAGLDVYSPIDWRLNPGERKLIPLNFRGEFPAGYVCDVRPRSGNALKKGLTVLNTPGTIDSDYRGIYGVILYNSNIAQEDSNIIKIKKGDKIAQLIFHKIETNFQVQITSEISSTERGPAGFGSSDTERHSQDDK